ncbi:MAG: FAD-binding protein, partial [Salinisphaeraceae bacterium]|nr:FAD-binding protein [Salinisphaeraceae bacterium]
DYTLAIDEPVTISTPDETNWDYECELLVVGLGAAGASAAIHAKEAGGDVLVIDRFGNGGATAKSGGIVYAGGGTGPQKKLGIDDTPEAMFNYLRQESGNAVGENTLRRFCEDSPAMIEWLESIGASFDSDTPPPKTSYPKDGVFLYYSGNEAIKPFSDSAKPAPRGHRTVDKGLSGQRLFNLLRERVEALQVPILSQCAAHSLVQDSNGKIIGVQASRLDPQSRAGKQHAQLITRADNIHNAMPARADKLRQKAAAIEKKHAQKLMIRASRGVLLSTGGFVFNQSMVAEHAPNYAGNMRLGTTGCDGSGIRLGQSVGGAVDRMHKASAWRFINPPQTWVGGMVVNEQGKRFCNEASYGARLGVQICDEQNGKAWLIIDSKLRKAAMREALLGGLWIFQSGPAILLMLFAKRARSIVRLAGKLGIPAESLNAQWHRFNHSAGTEGFDELGKDALLNRKLDTPPYYALNISAVNNPLFPCPTITLGGLKVHEDTGLVLNQQG